MERAPCRHRPLRRRSGADREALPEAGAKSEATQLEPNSFFRSLPEESPHGFRDSKLGFLRSPYCIVNAIRRTQYRQHEDLRRRLRGIVQAQEQEDIDSIFELAHAHALPTRGRTIIAQRLPILQGRAGRRDGYGRARLDCQLRDHIQQGILIRLRELRLLDCLGKLCQMGSRHALGPEEHSVQPVLLVAGDLGESRPPTEAAQEATRSPSLGEELGRHRETDRNATTGSN